MNYLRRFIALILSIIFCVALVIGLGVILAVKNVNIQFVKYSADGSDERIMQEYNATKQNLEKLKGSNLLFLSQDDIQKNISNDDYIYVADFEKVFPCTVNVTLKERKESLAIQTDDGYYMYDEEGTFIRKAKSNLNPLDDSPNVLVNADASQIVSVATMCSYFKGIFSTLRNLVESVEITDSILGDSGIFTFNFYSGIKIVVSDYLTLSEDKIKRAYEEYNSLSEKDKLHGAIRVVNSNSDVSSIQAVYIG
jgi:cell division septal protein FtsQ